MSGIKVTPADAKLSKWVRFERDGGFCQRCWAQPADPRGLHAAHMFSRRCAICTGKRTVGGKRVPGWKWPHYCVRLDESNLIAACYGCHQHLDSHPKEKEELFRLRLGDEAFERLELRAAGVVSPLFLKTYERAV